MTCTPLSLSRPELAALLAHLNKAPLYFEYENILDNLVVARGFECNGEIILELWLKTGLKIKIKTFKKNTDIEIGFVGG